MVNITMHNFHFWTLMSKIITKEKKRILRKDSNKKRKLSIYSQINKELKPDDGFQRVQLNMVKGCLPPFYAGMRRQMLSDENFSLEKDWTKRRLIDEKGGDNSNRDSW